MSDHAEYCKTCRATIHADCKTCEYHASDVVLMDANRTAMRLWGYVQTMWRVTQAGLLGLDWPSVYHTAEIHSIKMDPLMFAKIQQLEVYEITRKVEVKPSGV